MREGPAVIDDESRRIAYGAKIPLCRLSDRPEFEYRAVAAVVFGFDADLLALAFRRSQQGLVFQDGVEIVDAAVESGEADHFVARGDLHGVVGDGVAVAGLVEGEAVDTKLEDRIFVCKFAYAPEPECVGYVVFAVGRFQDEVTSAADGECSFLFERIASGRFFDQLDGAGPGVHRDTAHAVHLDVVEFHQARRNVVAGADHAAGNGVEGPLRAGVADLEMQVRACGRACISRPGELLALFERKPVGRGIEIDAVSPGAVTLLVYVFFDVVAELREVPIYGSRAVGMGDVDGASIAARRDGDA